MSDPTHMLLIPMDDITAQGTKELTERAKSKLPGWITPVFVPMMRGDAVLLPIAATTTPVVKFSYPNIVPATEWASAEVARAVEDLTE